MGLDLGIVAVPGKPWRVTWDSTDAIVYALSVGAGFDDPCTELEYTTEGFGDSPQRVLPTFASLFGARVPPLGSYDRHNLLHVGQGLELARPLPVSGELQASVTVNGIYDLGSAALVTTTTHLRSLAGEVCAIATSEFFIRGAGGFGGERPTPAAWSLPNGAPDHVIACQTLPAQALIYRLNGDRNPIHCDPVVARKAGFERPILHGLCTYGMAARAVMRTFVDPEREWLCAVRGRFTSPVLPGDTLRVEVWHRDEEAVFRVLRGDGTVIFDRGGARKARLH